MDLTLSNNLCEMFLPVLVFLDESFFKVFVSDLVFHDGFETSSDPQVFVVFLLDGLQTMNF